MPVASGTQSTEVNMGNTPTAPTGKRLVTWQAGSPYPDPNNPGYQVRDVSAYEDAGAAIGAVINGGGSAPSTGFKGYFQAPWSGTITGESIASDVAGSCSIEVKKCTDAAFPTTTTIGTITLGTLSPLVTAQKAESTVLAGTTFNKGDWFEFRLTGVSTLTWATLKLQITKD
ncbi:MAG: hypothetical protein ACM3JB_07245 [Acidobacteriaceae bacterium]